MPSHEFSGDHELINSAIFGAEIIDGGSLRAYGCGFGALTVTDGIVILTDCTVSSLTVVDGSVIFDNLRTGIVTIASSLGNSIWGSGLSCTSLTMAGGASFQELVIDGLEIPSGRLMLSGAFAKLAISGLVLGQKTSSVVYATGGLLDLDGVGSGRISGLIQRAYRTAIRINDGVGLAFDVDIVDAGANTDNTYDAISLSGTGSKISLTGSIKGAVNTANNPRYGVAVASGYTDVDIDMDITGCQTGEINNSAGLEVSRKVRVSTETLADGDVLVWDGTGLIFRPDSGGGIGGGGGAGGEGVAQVTPMSFPGALTDAYTGQHRMAWPWNVELLSVRPTVGTPPSGDDTIIDVLLLTAGVGPGTSIFPTTANPQVDDGDNVGAAVVPDTVAVTAGNAITVNIDTAAGAEDLTVIVEWMRVA